MPCRGCGKGAPRGSRGLNRKVIETMKIHTVFITYNRLELTKRAIKSYFETVTVPHTVVVVDNASHDGTQDWLNSQFLAGHLNEIILLDENKYPGYACNRGWSLAPDDATHLHRADNDFIFLPGWVDEVAKRFARPDAGQVGLRTAEEELFTLQNVGGNCMISREIWDEGLRYDETPWTEYPAGFTEDSYFSPEVKRRGYMWFRVRKPCIEAISSEDPDDPYYQQTWADRRIGPPNGGDRRLE